MFFLKTAGRRLLAASSLGLCLVLAGCGSKVTKENFEKVHAGMTQAEVEAILGTGNVQTSGGGVGPLSVSVKTETWQDGNKQISVVYDKDNKVALPPAEKGL